VLITDTGKLKNITKGSFRHLKPDNGKKLNTITHKLINNRLARNIFGSSAFHQNDVIAEIKIIPITNTDLVTIFIK